jgi:hypothetical protein
MENLKKFADDRGVLVPIEFSGLPFPPKRLFYIQNVPSGTWRGGHAHRTTKQVLICISGAIEVKLESKDGTETFMLKEGQQCFIDSMIWDSQKFIDENSILLVICSTEFNKEDYIFEKSHIM